MKFLPLLFIFLTGIVFAQQKVRALAGNLQYGAIIPHSKDVQNTSGANPISIQLEYDMQRFDSLAWERCRCHPRSGFFANFTTYDVGLLGHGFQAGYYLEPSYYLKNRLEFGLRSALALSYSSNPYDSFTNPTNQSYGTALNIYTALGIHLGYSLAPLWQVYGLVQFNHISNGGLRNPNKGVNWLTGGLGLRYRLQPVTLPKYNYKNPNKNEVYWRWDFAPFIARRTIDSNRAKRYSILGLAFSAARNKGGLHSWIISTEITYDDALTERAKAQGLPLVEPWLVGVAAGHEFLLGQFVFNQQLGAYLTDFGPYYNRIYHRWALWFRPTEFLGIGASLKAHRHVANFVDLRIIYSINRKTK